MNLVLLPRLNQQSYLQVATLIAVYANWSFARIKGVGWGWAGVIWLYSIVFFIPLDWIKFAIRYILSGKAWDNLLERKVWHQFNVLLPNQLVDSFRQPSIFLVACC